MKRLELCAAGGKSVILCGSGAFEEGIALIPSGQKYIITDSNVYAIYSDLFGRSFPDAHVYVMKAGERSKNYGELFKILRDMGKKCLTRGAIVIAAGGGVVGDIGGLAASLYMRGVYLVQIATSLLAQVDSSVGGKTAVDLSGIKNIVGTFYQPGIVIADPMFLATLPRREVRCGLGEIVKYASIDAGIYARLSACVDPGDSAFLGDIVYDCIARKAKAVAEDEKDLTGERRLLNAGHTVGHALELTYGLRSHGEYVATGLYFEMWAARRKGLCGDEFFDGFCRLIREAAPCIPHFENISKAARAAMHDKKNGTASEICIIAPVREGECAEIRMPYDEFEAYLSECNDAEKPAVLSVPRLGLIGKDVSRSLSGGMHEFIAKKAGYAVKYENVSVSEEGFGDAVEGLFGRFDGFNVTIPYKLKIIPYLEKLCGDAAEFGSVNTVSTRYREGYNTDGEGFALMLENAGIDVKGKRCLLIGAGGAGRSVAKTLKDMGAEVHVNSATGISARKVAEEFSLVFAEKIVPGDYEIIVNASGVGMHDSVGVSPVGEDVMGQCETAIDLIYSPAESEFLRIARTLGKRTLNGLPMLFYQAYYADCIFFGLEPDAKSAKRLFEAFVKEENL